MPKGNREGPKPAAVVKAQRGAKKGTQKGKARHFTSPEELAADAARLEEERLSGRQHREENEEKKSGSESSSDSSGSSSSSDSDDEDEKTKGVEGLIEIENPNRVVAKSKKIADITLESAAPQLSRREREEIEKEKNRQLQEKLRAEGKTEQARADLARLALIRQEREQAAKRREAEAKVKEAARVTKVEATPSMKKDDPAPGTAVAGGDAKAAKK
ncbi:28 kDa heat- and acid-stable phosphoprotein-like [Paramacrobiotus metropolitanus]|uniref:28 kDa heat- and acid-stable phosphoprotein-like n=1 Tax=Paramacrobiotus metropolitanus TaxID=2943436 RepID=UPI00244574A3|nr:28 kDa heat- and acid-stable phosphoprotein-like [Paramacrobiotus metropolitanus]